LAFARANAGSNKAARIAMMAITTNNSMSVKAVNMREFLMRFIDFLIR
jgi:hypothetical protein